MDKECFHRIDFKFLNKITSQWTKDYPCIEKIVLTAKDLIDYAVPPYYIAILNDMDAPEDQLNDISQYDMAIGIEEKFYDDYADSSFIGHHIADKETRRLVIKHDWEVSVQYTYPSVIPNKWAFHPIKQVVLFEREDLSNSTVKNEEPNDKKMVLPSEDIEQKLRNITIRHENDTQITIQQKSKPQIAVDLTDLRFQLKKHTKTITWDNFLKALQNPPHYWKCPEDADKKQIKVISDRLIEWISKKWDIKFPDKYRLHEIVKGKESGTYRFKFNIKYSDTIDIDESSEETFKKEFFYYVEDYRKKPDESKMARIKDMASNGLIKGFLTDKEIRDALKPATQIVEEDMTMDLNQDDGEN